MATGGAGPFSRATRADGSHSSPWCCRSSGRRAIAHFKSIFKGIQVDDLLYCPADHGGVPLGRILAEGVGEGGVCHAGHRFEPGLHGVPAGVVQEIHRLVGQLHDGGILSVRHLLGECWSWRLAAVPPARRPSRQRPGLEESAGGPAGRGLAGDRQLQAPFGGPVYHHGRFVYHLPRESGRGSPGVCLRA